MLGRFSTEMFLSLRSRPEEDRGNRKRQNADDGKLFGVDVNFSSDLLETDFSTRTWKLRVTDRKGPSGSRCSFQSRS